MAERPGVFPVWDPNNLSPVWIQNKLQASSNVKNDVTYVRYSTDTVSRTSEKTVFFIQHNIVHEIPAQIQCSFLIHSSPIVSPVQKPKAAWLLYAETEAAFCLRRVHWIILVDGHWLIFSSYHLHMGPAARTNFLWHWNNLIIEVCQSLYSYSLCASTSKLDFFSV